MGETKLYHTRQDQILMDTSYSECVGIIVKDGCLQGARSCNIESIDTVKEIIAQLTDWVRQHDPLGDKEDTQRIVRIIKHAYDPSDAQMDRLLHVLIAHDYAGYNQLLTELDTKF